MTAQFGAHEVMEMHEVLTSAIDGINQLQLYRPHAKDPQLRQIIDNHMQFMMNEYNGMVQALNQRGMVQAVPYGLQATLVQHMDLTTRCLKLQMQIYEIS